ncbi:phosphatidylinositol-3-phosphatase ymr1 [Coemansia thaxteri]|uniref:Phosphatidylinositol-3-phosphatase ymr1 n=1 Tax=Coemansia thaxteri TaxID=2663907 RepID=A0A9W8BLR5_9FUNG|nr:phosphatidylinositol-3-phosphatase ymr1 [Coemansia thaxteri]KAJ2485209.1 phosphatidylinositol-3-phosphatase ymr1 [Coemansia sp. RSA 2320]
MDYIRVAKVDRLRLKCTQNNGEDGVVERIGTLHLTTHHLIFSVPNDSSMELWLGYPMIHSAVLVRPPRLFPNKQRGEEGPQPTVFDDWIATSASKPVNAAAAWALEGSIRIRCHHFLFLTLRCEDVRQLYDVFATMKHLACVSSIGRLYAFSHREAEEQPANGSELDSGWSWGLYNPREEFARMGVGSSPTTTSNGQFWRFTDTNIGFGLCPTYPPTLVVPAKISDTTLTYAAKYRSKCRLPVLCYLHPNRASMTRSSQPMVGLKQARSVQDEKLIEAILASSEPQGNAPRFNYERNNIIIDARPTTNAVVNRAVGAGSENMDHYKRCRKVYLGIDNIHVMRDALNKVVDAIIAVDDLADPRGVVARIQSAKSSWLRHIENILVGVKTIVEAIDAGHHVVVHCSDGWDRTAQLTSLAQLCLDPYYRTIRGFAVLIEKEWVSFGHQFSLRCGHTGHPDRFKVVRASVKRKPSPQVAQKASAVDDEGIAARLGGTSSDNSSDQVALPPPPGIANMEEEEEAEEVEGGFDFLQTSTSMFGRFASKALRGMQSRISSAIQAASDNLDDSDDPDPYLADYPDLQPNFAYASSSPSATSETSKPRSNSHMSSSGAHGNGGGFKFGRSKHDHETSPVFQQFLECVYQLWVQHPTMFEFGEELLLDLFYHLHSAQFGTFLGNNMKERQAADFAGRTASIWTFIGRQVAGNPDKYLNPLFQQGGSLENAVQKRVIVPDPGFVQYWSALFSCHDPIVKNIAKCVSKDDEDAEESSGLSAALAEAKVAPEEDSNVWG